MLSGLSHPGLRMNVGKTLFAQVMEFVISYNQLNLFTF